jgi:hypothetical protein
MIFSVILWGIGAEEARASVGEALGVGGRSAHQRGGAGWRRRREGEVGALTGGGVARGIAGSGAHWWGRRGAEEAGAWCRAVRGRAARGWDAWGQESWGRLGGTRSDGWRGVRQVAWVGRAHVRGQSVGCVRFGWSIGPLGSGDGSLVHHPRWWIVTSYIYIYIYCIVYPTLSKREQYKDSADWLRGRSYPRKMFPCWSTHPLVIPVSRGGHLWPMSTTQQLCQCVKLFHCPNHLRNCINILSRRSLWQ